MADWVNSFRSGICSNFPGPSSSQEALNDIFFTWLAVSNILYIPIILWDFGDEDPKLPATLGQVLVRKEHDQKDGGEPRGGPF